VLFEKEAIALASKLFHEMVEWLKESPLSTRQLGFMTGFLIMIRGFLACIINFLILNIPMALLDFLTFVIGGVAMSIEYKEPRCPRIIKDWIIHEMLFIYKPFGRPAMYLFIGLLIAATGDCRYRLSTESVVCGGLISIFALIALINTLHSEVKVEASRNKERKVNDIMNAFNAADTDRSGVLSTTELITFLHFLDPTLNGDELEVALLEMDSEHDETVNVKEVLRWYEKRDEEYHV
jgi:hypothetical protein